MKHRHAPRLRSGSKIRVQPVQLFLSSCRIQERKLRIKDDKMNGTVIETVVALLVIRKHRTGAVLRQKEKVSIRQCRRRAIVVVSDTRVNRARSQPVLIDVEERVVKL